MHFLDWNQFSTLLFHFSFHYYYYTEMHSCVGENLGHPEIMCIVLLPTSSHMERGISYRVSCLSVLEIYIYANGSNSTKEERRDEKRVTFQ